MQQNETNAESENSKPTKHRKYFRKFKNNILNILRYSSSKHYSRVFWNRAMKNHSKRPHEREKKVCHSNWNSLGRRGLKMDFTTYYPTNTHHISNKRRKPLKKKCCYSRKTTSNRRSPQTDCAILCTKDTPLKEDAFSWWFIRRTFISYRQCNCTAQKEVLISTKKHRTEEASR